MHQIRHYFKRILSKYLELLILPTLMGGFHFSYPFNSSLFHCTSTLWICLNSSSKTTFMLITDDIIDVIRNDWIIWIAITWRKGCVKMRRTLLNPTKLSPIGVKGEKFKLTWGFNLTLCVIILPSMWLYSNIESSPTYTFPGLGR